MPLLSADADHEVQQLCRRVSNLVGWPLRYVAVGSDSATAVEARLRSRPESLWSAEVHDGRRAVGLLYIDLPDDCAADRTFLTVCGLGEVVAELLGTVASARAALEARTQDLADLAAMSRPPSPAIAHDWYTSLEQLLRGAVKLTGFRAAAFFLLQPDAERLALRAVHAAQPLDLPLAVRDRSVGAPDFDALVRGSLVLHRDVASRAAEWIPDGMSTAVCLAVRAGAGPLGTFWAFDRRRRLPQDRDYHVLESVAAQIAVLLERTALVRESAQQQRLRRDVRVASECQSRDLAGLPRRGGGCDVAVICRSRFELGGDLCEVIPLSPTRTALVIGDAAGAGVPAAMIAATMRGAVRSLFAASPAAGAEGTSALVSGLNRTLHSVAPPHLFMSLLLGLFDSETKTLTYTNAGHPVPLLCHAGEFSPLRSHGLLLGVLNEAEYEQSTVPLASGDTLVLFSDGITEAMSRARRMFRSDGIRDAVAAALGGTADEILRAIWSRFEEHVDGGDSDDRTLMVLTVD